jgi:hypothetical protein
MGSDPPVYIPSSHYPQPPRMARRLRGLALVDTVFDKAPAGGEVQARRGGEV